MTQQLHGCIADLLLVAVRRSALLLDEARAVLIPVELNNGLADDQHGSRASWSGFCMCTRASNMRLLKAGDMETTFASTRPATPSEYAVPFR
jgi:hypothetical protein